MSIWDSEKFQFLVNLDVFPKLRDDVKIKTGFGGLGRRFSEILLTK